MDDSSLYRADILAQGGAGGSNFDEGRLFQVLLRYLRERSDLDVSPVDLRRLGLDLDPALRQRHFLVPDLVPQPGQDHVDLAVHDVDRGLADADELDHVPLAA